MTGFDITNPTQPGSIWIQESFVNATEGYRFGDGEVYETAFNETGKLFRELQGEYGRCISKVYIDGPKQVDWMGQEMDSKPIQIGWVFQKTMEYEDARADWPKERREYVREVWVTLHKGPPTQPPTVYNYLYPKSMRGGV